MKLLKESVTKEFCSLPVIITTFLVLVYICIGIDYVSNYINPQILNHPLFRFLVLALMAIAFSLDHYTGVIIGFAYLLTKHQMEMNKENFSFLNSKPTFTHVEKKAINSKKKYKTKANVSQPPISPSIENELTTKFTNKSQFKDAQSNVVNDTALNTEIRTWDKGYGAQGGVL
tara:strand:+ start:19731 stop:20249 length:519 start_codon:yes stop_codon:yes gene_type:complete